MYSTIISPKFWIQVTILYRAKVLDSKFLAQCLQNHNIFPPSGQIRKDTHTYFSTSEQSKRKREQNSSKQLLSINTQQIIPYVTRFHIKCFYLSPKSIEHIENIDSSSHLTLPSNGSDLGGFECDSSCKIRFWLLQVQMHPFFFIPNCLVETNKGCDLPTK